jgi:endo-1,4-beta-xylanase
VVTKSRPNRPGKTTHLATVGLPATLISLLVFAGACSDDAGTNVDDGPSVHSGGEPGTGGTWTGAGGHVQAGGTSSGDGGAPPDPRAGGAGGSGGDPTESGGRSSGGADNSGGAEPLGSGGTDTNNSGGSDNSGGTDSGTGGELGEIPRFVGNITTGNSVDSGDLIYSEYWDQITPENAGKWGSVQGQVSGAPNWSSLDAIYAYAQDNGLVFKQHAFVWGSQQPSGSVSEADVKNWMTSFCERYPAARMIDVVNEPPPHTTPNYTNAIGGGTNGDWRWITNSFIWAREACPDAILILNDFNNIEWSGDNQHFINIVNTVLDAGGPIDAIGAQAHDLDNGAVSFDTVNRLLDKLHNDTGLPVYITEMDLSYTDDQQQLSGYQQYFPLFWGKEYVPGITIWGWIYGRTWSQAPNSGLVRDGQSRSAMNWLMDELGRPAP